MNTYLLLAMATDEIDIGNQFLVCRAFSVTHSIESNVFD